MKIGKIYDSVLREVGSDVYELIKTKYSKSRLIMSKDDKIDFRSTPIGNQEVRFKPMGLWYGIGSSWIDWVRSEMPAWESENVFKIGINESRIKIIRVYDELVEFDKEYGVPFNFGYKKYTNIDWGKVANDYGGIEIVPYIYEARRKIDWYYGWDVASGCIWGNGVINKIERLNK